jgi:hypothetical protein
MSSSGNTPRTRQLVQGHGDAERGNEIGLGILRSGNFFIKPKDVANNMTFQRRGFRAIRTQVQAPHLPLS